MLRLLKTSTVSLSSGPDDAALTLVKWSQHLFIIHSLHEVYYYTKWCRRHAHKSRLERDGLQVSTVNRKFKLNQHLKTMFHIPGQKERIFSFMLVSKQHLQTASVKYGSLSSYHCNHFSKTDNNVYCPYVEQIKKTEHDRKCSIHEQ